MDGIATTAKSLGAGVTLAALLSLASQVPALAQAAGQGAVAVGRTPVVTVNGDVTQSLTLSMADLAAMPRRVVDAPAEHGQPAATYEGVALRDILSRAGVPLGSELHGQAMATYVLCSAADGYRVLFSVTELDSAFTDRTIVLVDHKDGKPLDAHDGPFRLVIRGDARPARWIRQLTTVTVRRVPP